MPFPLHILRASQEELAETLTVLDLTKLRAYLGRWTKDSSILSTPKKNQGQIRDKSSAAPAAPRWGLPTRRRNNRRRKRRSRRLGPRLEDYCINSATANHDRNGTGVSNRPNNAGSHLLAMTTSPSFMTKWTPVRRTEVSANRSPSMSTMSAR